MVTRTISTVGMTHDEWLLFRRDAIGGSDAAAIIGLNPYASPLTVWMDKLGKSAPKEETEAMRIGHDLEDYVAKRWEEATGKKVRRKNAIIYNDAYPFAHANIDRDVVGENALLECKTTNVLNLKKFKNGDFPATYYVQCMHYIMVTGAERAYLAVLVLGQGFYHYTIERNEDEIAALAAAESEFWGYVQRKEEPPAVGMKCDSEALNGQYPQSNGAKVDLFGRASSMARFLEIKEQVKKLEAEADEIANIIKQELGENERGEDGNYYATWKTQARSTFDAKRFAKENPDVDLTPYYKASTARVFSIKETK